jgi:hypothetical protein
MPAILPKPLTWKESKAICEQCQSTATNMITAVQQPRPVYKYHARTKAWTKPKGVQLQTEGGGRAQEPITGRKNRRSSSIDSITSKDLSKLAKVGKRREELEEIHVASDDAANRSPLTKKEEDELQEAVWHEHQEGARGV